MRRIGRGNTFHTKAAAKPGGFACWLGIGGKLPRAADFGVELNPALHPAPAGGSTRVKRPRRLPAATDFLLGGAGPNGLGSSVPLRVNPIIGDSS